MFSKTNQQDHKCNHLYLICSASWIPQPWIATIKNIQRNGIMPYKKNKKNWGIVALLLYGRMPWWLCSVTEKQRQESERKTLSKLSLSMLQYLGLLNLRCNLRSWDQYLNLKNMSTMLQVQIFPPLQFATFIIVLPPCSY